MGENDILLDFWKYVKYELLSGVVWYISLSIVILTLIGTFSFRDMIWDDCGSFIKYKVFKKTPPSKNYYTINVYVFILRLIYLVFMIFSWIYFIPIIVTSIFF